MAERRSLSVEEKVGRDVKSLVVSESGEMLLLVFEGCEGGGLEFEGVVAEEGLSGPVRSAVDLGPWREGDLVVMFSRSKGGLVEEMLDGLGGPLPSRLEDLKSRRSLARRYCREQYI